MGAFNPIRPMELINPKLAAAAVSLRTIVGMDQKIGVRVVDASTKNEQATEIEKFEPLGISR